MTALKYFLIASVLLGFVAPTMFYANGIVRCTIQRHWCFFISFVERDPIFKNDRLGFSGVHCPSREEFDYSLQGEEDGDGYYNHEYELTIYVNHNCTTYGSKKRVEREKQYEPVTKKVVSINWNVTLDNEGYEATSYA